MPRLYNPKQLWPSHTAPAKNALWRRGWEGGGAED